MVGSHHRAHLAIVVLLAASSVLSGCIDDQPGPATAVPLPATAARPPLATAAPPATPLPAPSPSPSPPPTGRTYTVRTGDTLSGIATQVYGDADQWRIIFEANRDRMSAPEQLQVGQDLRIPPLPAR
jgi:nucleoid-associated protein YgaU